MAFTFIQGLFLLSAIAAVVLSAYNQNLSVFFGKKGITTSCSKNAMKNTRIWDAATNITYICIDITWTKGTEYNCTLYPSGDKQHPVNVDIDFTEIRGNAKEPVLYGTQTLTWIKSEQMTGQFAAENALYEKSPKEIIEKLTRMEAENIRLKAQVTELEAIGHQQIKKVLEEVGAMVGKSAQSRGGFPK